MAMTHQPRFSVLGPVRAWRGDVELDLGSPQQRAVLAALLLREGSQATITELIDALWDVDPPRAASGTVRTYLYRLRRVLTTGAPDPADVIESVGGGYTLRVGPEDLDYRRFRELVAGAAADRADGDLAGAAASLRSAEALWQGSALAGVPGPYAQSQGMRLESLRRAAIEDRLAIDLDLGRHSEAVTELSALVADEPLCERLRQLLILALYRSGRKADALASYREVRRLLGDELGLDPGRALQDLHQRILTGDPTLLIPADRRTPATAAPVPARPPVPPVPAQLPADLADFTGRVEIMRTVTTALSAVDRAPVVGLVGLAGVGTSTLAVHAAHAVRDRFPDGQLYLDLRGPDEEPVEARQALGSFLRAYGVGPDSHPDSLAERAALWRTVLDGRRVLMVLDHARDAEQLRHLLPASPGSAVIVTADRRMAGVPAARWSTVDAFRPDESLALMERVAGADRVRAEPEPARRYAEICSHLPLAVRLAAARLAARPEWSVAAIEDRLRVEIRQPVALHEDCIAVEVPFERAYGQLDPRQATAFCLAALPDGPDLDLAAVASLLDLPPYEAERVMESLADVHLVETGPYQRYRYQSVVRWFARRKALLVCGSAQREEALARLARFHRTTAVSSARTLSAYTDLPSIAPADRWAGERVPAIR
ncbi:AfsR/SARP family transcriptional regulator [Micromonospora sp. NBC_01796]|uniref:AfsR/SARP family transcriptional regulator n=1 Tax=Micromonospora sp. NBC_01796 TaxID=2975987 RepID=UPI002DDB983E|nr:BTAD domain-containing putative transcriptional regulator [Micromonospora sp. NBC_01796]WSA84369.1 NB-ARC domain-containing protein [Micromonospora sp. NBC_01796]